MTDWCYFEIARDILNPNMTRVVQPVITGFEWADPDRTGLNKIWDIFPLFVDEQKIWKESFKRTVSFPHTKKIFFALKRAEDEFWKWGAFVSGKRPRLTVHSVALDASNSNFFLSRNSFWRKSNFRSNFKLFLKSGGRGSKKVFFLSRYFVVWVWTLKLAQLGLAKVKSKHWVWDFLKRVSRYFYQSFFSLFLPAFR